MKKNRPEKMAKIYYVFIESVSKTEIVGTNPYIRTQYMLDAIDERYLDSAHQLKISDEGLSIMRLQTTTKRLGTTFELDTDRIEGRWASIELGIKPGMPHVWKLNATDSYSGNIERFNLISFSLIDSKSNLGKKLISFCTVKAKKILTLSTDLVKPVSRTIPIGVRVVDVGHASCIAIHVSKNIKSKILGYYDVGAPVFFHLKAFPKTFADTLRVPSDGFVVLSHWDFDHYALAVTKMHSLQKLKWFAPDQPIGPNASRLQKLLGVNLTFVNTPYHLIQSSMVMWKGTAHTDDRNNSGYAMRIGNDVEAVLLTGDVGYDYLPSSAKANIRGLGITHHGGNGSANPPPPLQPNCVAAVSYGLGNRYKHPNIQRLTDHTALGWEVVRTAEPIRGDRWL